MKVCLINVLSFVTRQKQVQKKRRNNGRKIEIGHNLEINAISKVRRNIEIIIAPSVEFFSRYVFILERWRR